MTYQETLEKALDRAHDAAEAVNEAAKNLQEVAEEQWGKITLNSGEGNNNGYLIFGVFVGVASILFVYGLCKVVNYLKKQKNEE